MRRTSLGARITALAVGIALVTGLLSGVLAINLIHSSGQASARHQLSQLADATEASLDRTAAGALAQRRAKRVLAVLGIQYGDYGPRGGVSGDPLATAALTSADLARLSATGSLSASRTVDGRPVYVEARSVGSQGIVLVQPRSDATAVNNTALRRTLLSILVGVAVAALVGGLTARRLARPLRRTAAAAHALAQGHRDVVVVPEGPAEVADVAEAITYL
ncbi:HAMP domain-containing protein, partial [Jatrophihabitans sp.]|uniref:HAMP domain-containing protein n=1 Tax=Jatrophihabitans sp. TaxID=1932789 RepID=UPI0030C742F8|nr:two-component system histidine kinase [Jatrophihabitans sp.]